MPIAQRRSDRREREAWQRERDRERQLWAREDALRNFEQRRDTYVSFYETLRKTVLKVYDHGMGLSAGGTPQSYCTQAEMQDPRSGRC